MRTNIKLEPDARALNSAVRAGLTHGELEQRQFVQKSYSLGVDQNFRWDKALEAAAALEDGWLKRGLLGFSEP